MQAGKNAGASAKETASNIAASAKAGMEKTKDTMQEKVEKMTAHDPIEKDMATQKKEEKKNQAELNKLEAREQNAAARQAVKAGGAAGTTATTTTHTHTTTGVGGYPTGGHQKTTVPLHGTGGHQTTGMPVHGTGQQHVWQETEDVVGSQPIGTTGAHATRATGGTNTGYGTGGR